MPNDDLGTFPMPPQSSPDPVVPTTPDPIFSPPPMEPPQPPIITAPLEDTPPAVPATPPIISTQSFEETPDEIPYVPDTPPQPPEPVPPQNYQPTRPETPEPIETPAEVPASLPPKSGPSITPIVIIVLLLIASAGLAASVYLYQQANNLKNQLSEITQTFNGQETDITPTPSLAVFEVTTPTPTMVVSDTASTASATPETPTPLLPLKNASLVLQTAVKHSPNAQLILIKVDNATDSNTAAIKYFFRQDQTTKKYFYVTLNDKGTPEIVDKQIYVTPDDNIPSLNDHILANSLGIDLDEAVKISLAKCTDTALCGTSPIKAQYIKTGTGIIWQLSLFTGGLSATPKTIQINATTKAVLYTSPGF